MPAFHHRPTPVGVERPRSCSQFAGASAVHAAAIRRAEQFARFEHATVLIEGESGTGKSFVARHIHASSPRAGRPFQQVMLSAMDDSLAASDLFGHLRGSYTDAREKRQGCFVAASGGTLFLDEIGKATPAVQRKLLHAVEHREIVPVGADRPVRVDVRIVAASNVSLDELVAAGAFLDDLAARLASFRVRLPALRERREDIPALVRQFVALRAESCGHPLRPPAVCPDLMRALRGAEWPRNLRQLDAVVQRLLMDAEGEEVLTLDHCADDVGELLGIGIDDERPSSDEIRAMVVALRSKAKAARELGISRTTVYRALAEQTDVPAELSVVQEGGEEEA